MKAQSSSPDSFRLNKKIFIIREYRQSDSVAEISGLLHRSYKPLAEKGFRYLATHQDDNETLRRLRNGKSYLAISEEKIISTISLYYGNKITSECDWYNNEKTAHFGQFAVLPEYQKMGLGNIMMNKVETEAKQSGANEIALDTAEGATELISFYEKRGYRFIEYVQWDVTNYRSAILSKTL